MKECNKAFLFLAMSLWTAVVVAQDKLKVQGDFEVSGDVVAPNGNVGIGTNTPEEPLHVVGNATLDGDLSVVGGDLSVVGGALNVDPQGGVPMLGDQPGFNGTNPLVPEVIILSAIPTTQTEGDIGTQVFVPSVQDYYTCVNVTDEGDTIWRNSKGELIGALPTEDLWGHWSAYYSYPDDLNESRITVDGTVVGNLKDLSGNDRHFLRHGQALFDANGANGFPIVRFSPIAGESPYFSTLSNVFPSKTFTVFAVVKVNSVDTGNDALLGFNTDAAVHFHYSMANSDTLASGLRSRSGNSYASVVGGDTTVGNYTLVAFTVRSNSGTVLLDDADAVTATLYNSSMNTLFLGRRATTITSGFLDMDFAEMAIYAADLDLESGVGLEVRQTFNAKYNLGLNFD